MRAGYARARITPPLGTPMMGFATRDQAHGCTGIHDDIYTRAVYLQQGEEAALIMGFDLCFVGGEDARRIKAAIGRKTGLRPRQILLNASHSHVGPAVGTWYEAKPSPAYLKQLDAAAVAAAVDARGSAREVTVWAGSTRSSLPLSRRLVDASGKAQWAPNPDGEVCGNLPVCLLSEATGDGRREKGRPSPGKPVCLLFSVSCHPSMGTGWEISAEYPGAAIERLDAHLGAPVGLFLQGAGGDAKPSTTGKGRDSWKPATWDEVAQAGQTVADEVIGALQPGLARKEPRLRAHLMQVRWPMQPPMAREAYAAAAADESAPEVKRLWVRRIVERLERDEKLPASVSLALHGIQIADGVRLVGIEGEAVAGLGRVMLASYPEGVTFPMGYTNGQGLYLPTSAMMDEGGYEVESYWEYGFPAPLAKGFEGILTRALGQMRARGVE